jgi:hypothetical protein
MGFDAMREYTQVKSVWINVDAQIPPHFKGAPRPALPAVPRGDLNSPAEPDLLRRPL